MSKRNYNVFIKIMETLSSHWSIILESINTKLRKYSNKDMTKIAL